MKKANALAALCLGTALLAGCGSSSSSSSSSIPATPAAPATTTSAASSAGPVALLTTKHNRKLGTILASGPKQLTVYLFEADKGTTSACAGTCANVWPPVTTGGQAKVGGKAMAANLGTITRPDGTMQVTYKGHPLYYFAKDKDNGDAYGEGSHQFGAGWYVLAPSGKKIDKS